MLDWLNSNFTNYGGDLLIYQDSDGFFTANGGWLSNQLLGCSIPPTYEQLNALVIASQGWQKIFDQWKERGIIQ